MGIEQSLDMGKLAECDKLEFERLVSLLSSAVINHLKKRFQISTGDAEDIWQDTLIKLIKRLSSFTDIESLQRWIFVVARNATTDRLRKEHRQNEYLIDLNKEELLAIKNSLHQKKDELLIDNVDEYHKRLLLEALNKIPLKKRKIIEMRYYLCYTEKEIASELKAPLGTIKAYLSKARNQLREQIKPFIKSGNF